MNRVYVDSTAIVDKNVNLGNQTKVWHFVHIMENCQIGNKCIIADYVHIGRNVKIGNEVKIENRVTIYEGVTIEDKVFVGPHVTFTNDLYPRSFNKDWKILPTTVKEGSSIGAGSIIICGVTIGKFALIGAGSLVTKNIPNYALAYGNPAKVRGFVCKCGIKLEKTKKTAHNVYMNCPNCNETFKILKEDFLKIEKE